MSHEVLNVDRFKSVRHPHRDFALVGIVAPGMQSGKDLVGRILGHYWGLQKLAFATDMKMRLSEKLATFDKDLWEKDRASDPYADVNREVLQYIGTDVCRDMDPMYHVRRWEGHALTLACKGYRGVYAPDTRFLNEAAAIHQRGGIIIAVEPRVVPPHQGIAGHPSEAWYQELRAVSDFVIYNDNVEKDLDTLITDTFQIGQKYLGISLQPNRFTIETPYKEPWEVL